MEDMLNTTSTECRMKINIKKKKALKISKGKETELVKEFYSLGTTVTTEANSHREI